MPVNTRSTGSAINSTAIPTTSYRSSVETVTVVDDSMPLGFLVINKVDFDPEVHKLYEPKPKVVPLKTTRRKRSPKRS